MKLFADRRLNQWYQSLNTRKVSDLAIGDEIVLTTENKLYFNGDGNLASNKFKDELTGSILANSRVVSMLKEKPNFDMGDLVESLISSQLGNDTNLLSGDMHMVHTAAILGQKDEFRYIATKLTEEFIANIKSKYADNDIITFEVVSLGKEIYGSDLDNTDYSLYCQGKPSFFQIEDVLSFYTEKVSIPTEEDVISFYKLVTNKTIERYHLLKCLIQGYKITDKDNTLFVVKESDFEELDTLIIMLGDKIISENNKSDNYEDSYLIIDEYFKSRDTVVKSLFFGALDIYNEENKLADLLPVIFS